MGSSSGLKSYLDGSTLVLSVARNSLFRDDVLPVDTYLIKNNSPVLLPLPAEVEYSLTSPLDGVSLDPGVSIYSDGKSSTILSVKSAPEATTSLKAKLTYKLPDGTLWTVESVPLTIRVRDEVLDVSPTIDSIRVGSIDATATGAVGISIITKNGS